MWLLQRLHIVDCALTATSSSVPHSKQANFLSSFGRSGARAAGLRTSWTRMYWPQCLQAVEMAARGSGCWWPQRAQVTRTLSCFFAGIQCSPPRRPAAGQRAPILAGSGILGTSAMLVRGGGVGATLFGFTSVLPTKVTPSSITSLVARMSPNSSVLALISILSLALMLPLTLPRTTTFVTLMWPLMTALSPRFKVPSVWISPSSFPSKVSSPANFMLPLISTSEFNTFFTAFPGVLIVWMFLICFGAGFRSYSNIAGASKSLFERKAARVKLRGRECLGVTPANFASSRALARVFVSDNPVTANAPPPKTPSGRLTSLDAYRGFVMFLMMAEVLRCCRVASALPESGFWKLLCHHKSHVEWIG